MKSIKEIFSFFKKKEEKPKKIQPKERKDHSLDRFVDAQERMYEMALAEVKSGKKLSHWIWYIFPQLRALGRSTTAIYYGIADLDEAQRLLQHPLLGERLREISAVLLEHSGKAARQILGDIDSLKARSCMTLFDYLEPEGVFCKVLEAFYGGERDVLTLNEIEKYKHKTEEL